MSAYVPPGGQPPPGTPAQPTGTAYPAGPQHDPWRPPSAPAAGQGLAVTALVLSGLALLVSLGVAVWLVYLSSGAGYAALTGQVGPVEGGQVPGSDLEGAITELHEDAGGLVETVACPETVMVSAEVVVTCRSVVDGFDWIEHVLFDDDGSFTLLRM